MFFSGDVFSACFLIDNGIDPNHTTYEFKTSALHLISICSLPDDDKAKVTSSLLQAGAQANLQDSEGRYGWYSGAKARTQDIIGSNLLML